MQQARRHKLPSSRENRRNPLPALALRASARVSLSGFFWTNLAAMASNGAAISKETIMFMNPVSVPRSRPPVRVTSGINTSHNPQPVQPPPKTSVNISAAAKAAAAAAEKAKPVKPGPPPGVTVNRFLTRAEAVWNRIAGQARSGS
nr:hypothetical protein [Herbaspirillum sp. ASV7]